MSIEKLLITKRISLLNKCFSEVSEDFTDASSQDINGINGSSAMPYQLDVWSD